MSEHAHSVDGPGVHVSPLKTYYTVFGCLLVLTVITVGVSEWMTLPPTLSIVVAMAVASVKASLVAAWFMHLKYDSKFNILVFLSAFWFIALFFIFTVFDLGSRDSVLAISGNRELRTDLIEAGVIILPTAHAAEHGDGHGDAAGHGEEGDHGEADGHAGEKAGEDEAHAEGEAAEGDAVADAGEEVASDFDAAAAYSTTCAVCHGATGAGDGPAGAALNPPAANFTDPAFWETRDDATVHKAIKEGGVAVGKSALMAPWSGSYDDAQIDALVAHLKTFKK